MFEQRLMRRGTLVRYDDWRNMRQRSGEARAHREVTRRFNVTWRNLVSRSGALNSREWEVVSYSTALAEVSLARGGKAGWGRLT